VILLIVLCKAQHPCNVVASDGSTYDLSRLAALGTISASDQNALWTYTVSVCGSRVSCGDGVTTGYCQKGTIGGRPYTFNVGFLDQTIALPNGEGVELIYFEPREQRAGRVKISCDPNALVSHITAITPEDPMNYEFKFSSIAGCSTVPPCKAESPSGEYYDLTAFIGTSPITASDDKGDYRYSVSVCQDGITKCDICSPSGYCQTSTDGRYTFCVGTYENITANDDGSGVVLTYEEPTQGRKGQVHIECDPTADLVSDITAISPPDIKGYAFYFKSYAACPVSTSTCKATAADGSAYDLRSLILHAPLWGVDEWNLWNYTVSICQDSLSCAGVDPAGYCQYRADGSPPDFCVGKFESIQGLNNGAGVKLTYKAPTEGRIGTVTITCDPNGPIVSGITAISPATLEGYEFNFKSSAACPKK